MDILIPIVFVVVIILLAIRGYRVRSRISRNADFIDSYNFPSSIRDKLRQKYPQLNEADTDSVMSGLREYFHLCNLAEKRMVSMPSQVVDVAWHEFILFTREYEAFCQSALGRFLHHTPAEAMKSPTRAQKGIKTAWRLACSREKIDARSPGKLPMIFSLDVSLSIPDGFRYALDCMAKGKKDYYCAGHVGCSSSCGGDSDGCGDGGCGGD